MWVVHQRMAELTLFNKKRPLTESELDEMSNCLEANLKMAQKFSALENLSLAASMINDTEWLHTICAQIETLQKTCS